MSDDGDGFVVVSRRKASRRIFSKGISSVQNMPSNTNHQREVNKEDVLARIASCRADILQSEFWSLFQETLLAVGLEVCQEKDCVALPQLIMNGSITDETNSIKNRCVVHCGSCKKEIPVTCQESHVPAVQGQEVSSEVPIVSSDTVINNHQSSQSMSKVTTSLEGLGLRDANDKEVVTFSTSAESHLLCNRFCEGKEVESSPKDSKSAPKLDCDCSKASHGDVLNGELCQDDVTYLGDQLTDLVCYGLGRFATCPIARYQIAFFLVLRDHFKISSDHCQIYDPVFSDLEVELLENLGCQLISCNEEAKRQVDTRTLFFMPHCGMPLYNNLLWANWDPCSLSRVNILGNSFSNIESRTPSRILKSEAQFMSKVFSSVTEHPIKNNFMHSDIFNELSLHTFKPAAIQKIPAEFWEGVPEPVYPINVEIIQNKSKRK